MFPAVCCYLFFQHSFEKYYSSSNLHTHVTLQISVNTQVVAILCSTKLASWRIQDITQTQKQQQPGNSYIRAEFQPCHPVVQSIAMYLAKAKSTTPTAHQNNSCWSKTLPCQLDSNNEQPPLIPMMQHWTAHLHFVSSTSKSISNMKF